MFRELDAQFLYLDWGFWIINTGRNYLIYQNPHGAKPASVSLPRKKHEHKNAAGFINFSFKLILISFGIACNSGQRYQV